MSDDARAELDALRADLGDTMEELAARVDVPARVRARRDEAAVLARTRLARARATLDERAPAVAATVREQPGIVAAAAVATVTAAVLVARRRSG